jgi:TatA/E family protein of Tat protein translocase
MLGIGGTELVIILIFGFLIFGPDRLPAMGRTIGRALRQFRQAQDQMNKMVKTEIYDPLNDAMKEPAKKQGPKKKVSAAGASTKVETFAEKKARLAAEANAKVQGTADGAASTEESAPAVPAKKAGTSETFAEKKARLDAEKKAAEAKKDEGAASGSATTAAKPKTTSSKKPGSAAKLYGIDKDRIAEARAAAAAKNTGKGDQADA